MATILLVRHGQTAWNREGRIQGWAPVGLTDRGVEQATALGETIAAEYAVDRIVTSDLRRAVETTRWIRRSLDAPISRDRAWRERDFGVYQGLDQEALFEGYPEFALLDSGHWAAVAEPEGGEALVDARARVRTAFEELATTIDSGKTVLVVTHGGPIRVVLAQLRGLDIVETLTELAVENCSLTECSVDERDPTIVREADTPVAEA
jgi:probable phosphoglycerate mutase